MKFGLILAVLLILSTSVLGQSGQPAQSGGEDWSQWQFLIGDWVGEGGGQPGQASSGGTTLSFDLDGHVLVRRNFSNYAATKDRPAISHRDLMVIYHDAESKRVRAIYWDNEGHVINYTASFSDDGKELTLLSPASDTTPRFRFIYRRESADRIGIEFDIAPPGKPDSFARYTEGFLRRR